MRFLHSEKLKRPNFQNPINVQHSNAMVFLTRGLGFNHKLQSIAFPKFFFLRPFMASSPVASYSTGSPAGAVSVKRVGTHHGSFHCDEALGCFMIRLTDKFSNAQIVRTRDPQVCVCYPQSYRSYFSTELNECEIGVMKIIGLCFVFVDICLNSNEFCLHFELGFTCFVLFSFHVCVFGSSYGLDFAFSMKFPSLIELIGRY